MKSAITIVVTVLLTLVGPSACAAPETKPAAWVDTLITKFASQSVTNPPRKILSYRYGAQTVYYVPPVCCDRPSVLYDIKGTVICAPDGGFTGRGDGRCADFRKKRREEALVWSDPRKR